MEHNAQTLSVRVGDIFHVSPAWPGRGYPRRVTSIDVREFAYMVFSGKRDDSGWTLSWKELDQRLREGQWMRDVPLIVKLPQGI